MPAAYAAFETALKAGLTTKLTTIFEDIPAPGVPGKTAAVKATAKFEAKALASKTHAEVGKKKCKVTVNETTFLDPAPASADQTTPSCCGGIVPLHGNNTIA